MDETAQQGQPAVDRPAHLVPTNNLNCDLRMGPKLLEAHRGPRASWGVSEAELARAASPYPHTERLSDYYEMGWIQPVYNDRGTAVEGRWRLTEVGADQLPRVARHVRPVQADSAPHQDLPPTPAAVPAGKGTSSPEDSPAQVPPEPVQGSTADPARPGSTSDRAASPASESARGARSAPAHPASRRA